MSKSLGTAWIALTFTITYVSTCSCPGPFKTDKQRLCNDDFARLYKIGANSTSGFYVAYEVEILKTFRTIPYTDLDVETLYTQVVVGQACGITLIQDAYYVVSGYYKNKSGNTQMRTSMCDLQQYLSKDQVPNYTPPVCDDLTEPGFQGQNDMKP